jgi:hypothetical protein
MASDLRLKRILVATSVITYAVAGAVGIALAFSKDVVAVHALGAACVMALCMGLTLFFGRQKDFMSGPLFTGQPVALAFATGVWVNLVLAAAGGLYPLLGVGRFIPFMGYVGSIAFIPPLLAGVVMLGVDRLREGPRK